MLLPFWDGLVPTKEYDIEMAEMADRHYTRRTVGNSRFMLPGRKLVLRDTFGTIVFGWLWQERRMDEQTGYNCAIFRNESDRLSSEIILEAEALAFAKWGPNRLYTYVNPKKIRSSNPGYCFQRAGWQKRGISSRGLVLLAKDVPLRHAPPFRVQLQLPL